MNAPTSAPVADDTSLPVKPALEEFPAQIENDTERTKSSLARLTSNSVDRLERLMSEIQDENSLYPKVNACSVKLPITRN
jgi:hypothetical protein